MNWNLTGRILVFVNVFLSLGLCFWAFSLYNTRIDREAKYRQQADEIKNDKAALDTAQARWEAARAGVLSLEAQRPVLLQWYADELQKLRNQGPVRALVYDKGQLRLDAQGYPALGQPLEGLTGIQAMNQEYARTSGDLAKVNEQIGGLQTQLQQLTREIGNARSGLRLRLAREQEQEKNSQAEQEWLKPILYNRLVEAQILGTRQRALQGRLKEVEEARVARQP